MCLLPCFRRFRCLCLEERKGSNASATEKLLCDSDCEELQKATAIRRIRRDNIWTILFLLEQRFVEEKAEDETVSRRLAQAPEDRRQQFVRIAKCLEVRVWRAANQDLDAYPRGETALKPRLREIVRGLMAEQRCQGKQTDHDGNHVNNEVAHGRV